MRMWATLRTASIAIAIASTVGCGASSGASPCEDPLGCFPVAPGDTGSTGWTPTSDGEPEPSTSSGSSSGGALDTGEPTGPQLPCDVAAALSRACGECHGDAPSFGAPMPLADYDDLHVPALTDPTRKVYELVAERIEAETKMMPPDGDITDEERATLLAWIDAGAPADPSADCEDLPPPEDDGVGPESLPCDDPLELTAHAPGSDEPFAVPAQGADDLYQCFAFKAPFTEPTQALAWAPIIDDERVVHHWILYRTTQQHQDGEVFPCDVSLQVTAEFVAGWAPGGGNVEMPAGVGLELGAPEDWYVLQVHYHNAAHYDDAADRSGVAFCVADTPQPQTAGVLTLGTTSINIPPGAVAHDEVGTCGGLLTLFWPGELHVLGSSPHMHQLGRAFRTELIRSGGGGNDMIVDVPQFNFENQAMYLLDQEIVVHPGDTLRTTCTYDNPGAQTVQFGEGTGDEMCFGFVLAYPIQQLANRNCGIVF